MIRGESISTMAVMDALIELRTAREAIEGNIVNLDVVKGAIARAEQTLNLAMHKPRIETKGVGDGRSE